MKRLIASLFALGVQPVVWQTQIESTYQQGLKLLSERVEWLKMSSCAAMIAVVQPALLPYFQLLDAQSNPVVGATSGLPLRA